MAFLVAAIEIMTFAKVCWVVQHKSDLTIGASEKAATSILSVWESGFNQVLILFISCQLAETHWSGGNVRDVVFTAIVCVSSGTIGGYLCSRSIKIRHVRASIFEFILDLSLCVDQCRRSWTTRIGFKKFEKSGMLSYTDATIAKIKVAKTNDFM